MSWRISWRIMYRIMYKKDDYSVRNTVIEIVEGKLQQEKFELCYIKNK